MSTNIIVTGDLHYRIQNPKARLDDYLEAIDTKLSEIYELATKHKARAIIIPGDIFDSAYISYPGVWGLARKFSDAPCPIITIPGNHDLPSHNLETIPRTPYGLLSKLGYTKCAHEDWYALVPESPENMDIIISGHGYNTETDIYISQYTLPAGVPPRFNIHVTHGMLLEKPMMEGVRHTLISDLDRLQNEPDIEMPHVLINGHYHLGLPLTRIGKTLIINPGALGRLTASVEEMHRTIKVALLTINSETDYHAEMLPLKSAQPGHVVLSREHIEEAEIRNERLETFLTLLNSEGEQKYLEIEEIMGGIANKENIPAGVIKEGLSRLGKAREIISGRG